MSRQKLYYDVTLTVGAPSARVAPTLEADRDGNLIAALSALSGDAAALAKAQQEVTAIFIPYAGTVPAPSPGGGYQLTISNITQAEWGAGPLTITEDGGDQLIIYESDGNGNTFTLPAHASTPLGRQFFLQSGNSNSSGAGGPASFSADGNDVPVNGEADSVNNPVVSDGAFVRSVVVRARDRWVVTKTIP
jgi:hypothetical protein